MSGLRVIPIGISSGVPTRERGVSAIALCLPGRWLLLDCGDGTQQRLMRAGLSLHQLEAVHLTHLHGDHVLGLPALLSTQSLQGRQDPLRIYGPSGIRKLLRTVLEVTQVHLSFELKITEIHRRWSIRTDAYSVRCMPLDHRIPAFGYRFDFTDRHALGSLAYCTDTRPTLRSAELAREVDLLIHEATYLDQFSLKAWERGHSTAAQAAWIARAADAEKLLLTHFSPRYTDPEVLAEEARKIFPGSEAARELQAVEVRRRKGSAEEQPLSGLGSHAPVGYGP